MKEYAVDYVCDNCHHEFIGSFKAGTRAPARSVCCPKCECKCGRKKGRWKPSISPAAPVIVTVPYPVNTPVDQPTRYQPWRIPLREYEVWCQGTVPATGTGTYPASPYSGIYGGSSSGSNVQ